MHAMTGNEYHRVTPEKATNLLGASKFSLGLIVLRVLINLGIDDREH